MTKLTIEKNALASLMLTLALVGVIVWMNVMGVERVASNTDQISRSNAILGVLQELSEHMLDVETGERGYIITGKEEFLEPFKHGLGEVALQREELARLIDGNVSEQGRLAELNKRIDSKIALSQANVDARKKGFDAAQARVISGVGKREMDALTLVLDDMSGTQRDRRRELQLRRLEVLETMRNNIAIAAVASIFILIYLHLRLTKLMNLRREDEQRLNHIASHDVLTGLPNRRLMLEHMEMAMQRCKRHKKSMALLFLDLNGFKPVNDQYGHKAGDEVLMLVAQRLSGAMRASDRVARFGGDEFVVLVEDISDKEDVCGIVGKVDFEIYQPFLLSQGVQVAISTSIGVAIYPRDAEDLEALMSIADSAMYESKKTESNCFCKEQKKLRRCVSVSDGER